MVKGGKPKKENTCRDECYRKYLWRWGRSMERKSLHSWGKPSTVDGECRGDRLFIGGPSLSDSTPLLRSSASDILADGWSTLRFTALCAFLYTTLEGVRQPSSAQYCSHRAVSSDLHSSSITWSWSFDGRDCCRRPFSAGTVVGKAAWTFSILVQFRSCLKKSQSLPTDEEHINCLDKEICIEVKHSHSTTCGNNNISFKNRILL